jgi:hypothetical protein
MIASYHPKINEVKIGDFWLRTSHPILIIRDLARKGIVCGGRLQPPTAHKNISLSIPGSNKAFNFVNALFLSFSFLAI